MSPFCDKLMKSTHHVISYYAIYCALDSFTKQKIQMSPFIKLLRVANHWPLAMSFDLCETHCLNPSFCIE